MKNLLVKLDLNGHGVVNYDSSDQKYVLKKTYINSSDRNNVLYAKKAFFVNEEDENKLDFKLKISHDCMLKNAFKDEMISRNPNIAHNDYVLYSHISNPIAIALGYLFPLKKANANTLKRTNSIMLTDAIQTCNAKSFVDLFSKSGEKTTDDDQDKTTKLNDNTLYYKERVGDIKYSAKAMIDLMNLQFISADYVFDRYNLNPDFFELYKENLKKHLPTFDGELGYYQLKNSLINIPELGFLLSKDNINHIVKMILKKLLALTIRRKDSYATTELLKIKIVNDTIEDTFDDPNNWITLKSNDQIDALDFDIDYFYDLVDMEEAKKLRINVEEEVNKYKKSLKDSKKKKNE